jgi:predicted phosphodiesterase
VLGALAAGAIAATLARALRPGQPRLALLTWLVAPALWAALLGFIVLLRAEDTFAPRAFDNPSFYARGAELPQLLSAAENAQEVGEGYSSSVQRALVGYATLLRGGPRLDVAGGLRPALQVSDLHGNTLVLRPLRRVVSGRPVFFVGDFGQSGTRAEADVLIPQVMKLGQRIVAVSGNHDSRLFMRELAGAGATVLTDRGRLRSNGTVKGPPTRRVAGLRIAGYPDPLEWRGSDPNSPRRVFSFGDLPNGEQMYARAERLIRRWFLRLRPVPDVVLIHQNGLAQSLARAVHAEDPGRSLLILTGHDHRQHIDRYGQVLVVDAGTVGAGGAFGAGLESVGVAELHMQRGETLPHAVDLIRVEPLSGAANAERVIAFSAEACDRDLVRCHDGDE